MRYTYKTRFILIGGALLALVLLAAGLLPAPTVLAQGGVIGYGQTVVDSISAQTPFVIYGFSGAEGDVITAHAVAITPDMALSVSLLGPQQEPLIAGAADPFGGGDAGEVRLSYRLPQNGLYSLLITESNGAPGEFVLHLNGRAAAEGPVLTPGIAMTADLLPGDPAQVFFFDSSPTTPTTLVVSALEPVDPAFVFLAQVYDGAGELLATVGGNGVEIASLTVAPADSFYEVLLAAPGEGVEGTVSLLISQGAAQQTQPPTQAQPTLPPPAVVTATPATCLVTSGTQANVRRGPGTVYDIVGALPRGSSAPVVGRSADGSWFVIDLNGRQGWISASVVQASGPCGGLTIFPAPPTPTPIATATPLPTPTPATSISFTADRYTINLGECATLFWNVQGVSAVYYQGQGVAGTGSQQVCPSVTTTYNLTVTLMNGQSTTQTVTITVIGGYRISFTTTANSITAGQCVTLSWAVEGVSAVYYQGVGVTGTGSQQECPAATTTYVLRVVTTNNQTIDTPITVTVNP